MTNGSGKTHGQAGKPQQPSTQSGQVTTQPDAPAEKDKGSGAAPSGR